MAEHQIPAQGSFVWNELATTDAEAATKFYTALLGWKLKSGDVGPMVYHEIIAGERAVGGIHQLSPECGGEGSETAVPRWMPYVSVDDVDATARRVEELGGQLCVPPSDIPSVGRFCVIKDPTGASISLITLNGASS